MLGHLLSDFLPIRRVVTFLFLSFLLQPLVGTHESFADSTDSILVIRDSENHADAAVYKFSFEDLESLPQKVLTTKTPWTDGMSEFSGPLLRDVIQNAGMSGSLLRCRALNDYTIDIPISDGDEYDVILAIRRDGKKLSVRDKGPIWIIYPWSDNPELWSETYFGRSIWQLRDMIIL